MDDTEEENERVGKPTEDSETSTDIDWKDKYSGPSEEAMEKARKRNEELAEERKDRIMNPDPEKEHQIFKKASEDFKWFYRYLPDEGVFEFVSEEQLGDGEPFPDYHCECGARNMSEEQAVNHIKSVE